MRPSQCARRQDRAGIDVREEEWQWEQTLGMQWGCSRETGIAANVIRLIAVLAMRAGSVVGASLDGTHKMWEPSMNADMISCNAASTACEMRAVAAILHAALDRLSARVGIPAARLFYLNGCSYLDDRTVGAGVGAASGLSQQRHD